MTLHGSVCFHEPSLQQQCSYYNHIDEAHNIPIELFTKEKHDKDFLFSRVQIFYCKYMLFFPKPIFIFINCLHATNSAKLICYENQLNIFSKASVLQSSFQNSYAYMQIRPDPKIPNSI